MSAQVQVFLNLATIVISLVGSAFMSGSRWGQVQTDVKVIKDRLARIEGMFVLTLRDEQEHRKQGLDR